MSAFHPGNKWNWGIVVQFPSRELFNPVGILFIGLCSVTAIMAIIGGFFAYKGANLLISVRDSGIALQRERDRSKQYLNIAGVLLCALDTEGRVILINRKGSEILGHKTEVIIGMNWFDNFLPERLRIDMRLGFQSLTVGDLEPLPYYEMPVLVKSGEERLIAFHNAVIRDANGSISGVLFSGEDITERKTAEAERESLLIELQEALAKVKVLREMLPFCSHCKKIRDDKGYWQQVDIYITEHTDTVFSHGLCPECMKKLYPDYC